MTASPLIDPFETLQMTKDWLSAQQRALPSGPTFEQMAEAVLSIAQANITYSQALMRANATVLTALLGRSLPPIGPDKPPSQTPRP